MELMRYYVVFEQNIFTFNKRIGPHVDRVKSPGKPFVGEFMLAAFI